MNRHFISLIFYLIILLQINCSENVSGGFGSETSNGMISSIWYSDSLNKPVSGAEVKLIPNDFNIYKDNDSLILIMITDDSGKAVFDKVPFGNYNLAASVNGENKKALYQNITVLKDSVYMILDTLKNSGATKLMFSQQPANQDFGCYIPGYDYALNFENSVLDSSGEYVLTLNNLPEMNFVSIYGYQPSADKQFLINDSNNIESNSQNDLFVDLVWSAYKYSDDNKAIEEITSVLNDSLGNTWFSQTGMIIKIDVNGNATFYESVDIGITIFPIRNSILDSVGNPLFSTSNGVIKYNGSDWSKWDIFNDEFIFQNILLRTYNNVTGQYCFTSNTGIRLASEDTTVIIDEVVLNDNDTISLLDITSLNAANDGKLWVGSHWDGVLIYDKGNWSRFSESLPSNYISDIVTYDDGRVIICTDEGVVYNNGIEWQTFNDTNSPLKNCIRASFAKNSLWVISDYNLYRFNGSKWNNFDEVNSMVETSEVTYLTIDEDVNRGYLGTKEGILVFDYR